MKKSIKADYQRGTERMRRFALRHGKYDAFLDRKWLVCCRVLACLDACDRFWKMAERKDADINSLANAECFTVLFCCGFGGSKLMDDDLNAWRYWRSIWTAIMFRFRTSEVSGTRRRWSDF